MNGRRLGGGDDACVTIGRRYIANAKLSVAELSLRSQSKHRSIVGVIMAHMLFLWLRLAPLCGAMPFPTTLPTSTTRISDQDFLPGADDDDWTWYPDDDNWMYSDDDGIVLGYTGTLPTQIGFLTGVTSLDFSFSRFTGPLPTELGQLALRKEMVFTTNAFSYRLPTEIGTLTELWKDMYLDANLFDGSLPTQLGNLVEMKSNMRLDLNHFDGHLPSELGNLVKMTSNMVLMNNDFCGGVPTQVQALSTGWQSGWLITLHNDFGTPCCDILPDTYACAPTLVPTLSVHPTASPVPTSVLPPSPEPSPAPCSCFTLKMYDSFGDGWNGAFWSWTSAFSGAVEDSGTLISGNSGQATLCGTGCYTFTVSGGEYPSEIEWSIGCDGAGDAVAWGLAQGQGGYTSASVCLPDSVPTVHPSPKVDVMPTAAPTPALIVAAPPTVAPTSTVDAMPTVAPTSTVDAMLTVAPTPEPTEDTLEIRMDILVMAGVGVGFAVLVCAIAGIACWCRVWRRVKPETPSLSETPSTSHGHSSQRDESVGRNVELSTRSSQSGTSQREESAGGSTPGPRADSAAVHWNQDLRRAMFKENTHDVLNKMSPDGNQKSRNIIYDRFIDSKSDRHVFISHASKDESHRIYETLSTFLQAKGVRVFNPTIAFQHAKPNRETMQTAVRLSQLVIASMSQEFFQSKWCQQEIEAAAAAGIPIVSVFSGDHISNRRMESWINGEFKSESRRRSDAKIAELELQLRRLSSSSHSLSGSVRSLSESSKRPRVHASFSSQVKSWLLSGIQDAVSRANMEYTAVHTAQKDGWFHVWSRKAQQAHYIIVLFTPEYKERFTEALWMEAQCVYELYKKGETAVYIFDSETMKPAEVCLNLQDEIRSMGSVSEWWDFCQSRQPVPAVGQVNHPIPMTVRRIFSNPADALAAAVDHHEDE